MMRDVDALVAELRKQLEAFDLEVDFHMRTEGERADLWEEIDVPVASVRALLDALESERSRADRLEKALTRCQHALAMLIDPNNERFNVSIQHAWAQCVEAETTARTALGKEDVSD